MYVEDGMQFLTIQQTLANTTKAKNIIQMLTRKKFENKNLEN